MEKICLKSNNGNGNQYRMTSIILMSTLLINLTYITMFPDQPH